MALVSELHCVHPKSGTGLWERSGSGERSGPRRPREGGRLEVGDERPRYYFSELCSPPAPRSGSRAAPTPSLAPSLDHVCQDCAFALAKHVEEWHSVSCAISSDKENVTVAVEISVNQAKQVLRDVTELQILGEISFNKSLYEGLNAENHRTKITVIFLQDKARHPLPLIVGSSVAGLLVLIVIIVILFKCGFFKRKYQQLNVDSVRKAQMESENTLTEDQDRLPRALGETVSLSSNL